MGKILKSCTETINKSKSSDTKKDGDFELPNGYNCFYQIFRDKLSRSMKHVLINHQYKYMTTEFIMDLHSKWKSWTSDSQNYKTTGKYWKKDNQTKHW